MAIAYKIASEWILAVELPATTSIGRGFRLRHGVGTVVNPASTIGQNVMIRQNVTIGNRKTETDCPRIGDNVEIGAGAVIVGDVEIGVGSVIGPLAYVDFDVPSGSIVVSQRAVILER